MAQEISWLAWLIRWICPLSFAQLDNLANKVSRRTKESAASKLKFFKFSCTKDTIDGGIDEEVIAASANEYLPNT